MVNSNIFLIKNKYFTKILYYKIFFGILQKLSRFSV